MLLCILLLNLQLLLLFLNPFLNLFETLQVFFPSKSLSDVVTTREKSFIFLSISKKCFFLSKNWCLFGARAFVKWKKKR